MSLERSPLALFYEERTADGSTTLCAKRSGGSKQVAVADSNAAVLRFVRAREVFEAGDADKACGELGWTRVRYLLSALVEVGALSLEL